MTTHEVIKRTLKRHANNGKQNMFLTYILGREPIQVSLKQNDPFQVQLSSSSNETVLHGPMLKMCARFRNNSLQDDSFQEVMVQFARFRYGIVCKR